MSFTPRLSAPTNFSTYYTERRIPAQPNGTPTYWQYFYSGDYSYSTTGAHTGNCTWYAMGRSAEIAGRNIYSEFAGSYEAQNWENIWIGNAAQTSGSIAWQPGDILIWANSAMTFGHVEVVEVVSENYLTISYSAYSGTDPQSDNGTFFNTRRRSKPTWGDPASLTSESDSRFIRNSGATYYLTNEYLIGVIHNPYYEPGPSPSENLEISISPSSYAVTMSATQDYVDFTFNITITGIPAGATVSRGNTYPGLSRVYNTGWSYTNYTVDGTTYQQATKTQTLRYNREHDYAYTTTKHMYYNLSLSTGTISTDTPMRINVQMKSSLTNLLLIAARRRKKGGIINVGKA